MLYAKRDLQADECCQQGFEGLSTTHGEEGRRGNAAGAWELPAGGKANSFNRA